MKRAKQRWKERKKREKKANANNGIKERLILFVSGCCNISLIFCLCLPLKTMRSINGTSSTYFPIANRIDNMNEYVIVWNAELKRQFSFCCCCFILLCSRIWFSLFSITLSLNAMQWPRFVHELFSFISSLFFQQHSFSCYFTVFSRFFFFFWIHRVWEYLDRHRLHYWSCLCLACCCTY